MAETDHPNGTCGMFCPYCRMGVPRTLEAVREYDRQWDHDQAGTDSDDGDYLW